MSPMRDETDVKRCVYCSYHCHTLQRSPPPPTQYVVAYVTEMYRGFASGSV